MDLRLIKTTFGIALLLLGCVAADAQEPIPNEKRELIKELLDLTGVTKSVNAMLEAMSAQQERDLPGAIAQMSTQRESLTPAERVELDRQIRESALRAMQRVKDFFHRINYPQMVADLAVPIFDKHYSESELRELIVFYKSPVGRKSVDVQPAMITEMMVGISKDLLPMIQDEVKKIVEEETKEATQHIKPVPAPPKARKPRRRSRH